MAYRFKNKESVRKGVRRIANEQLDKAFAELDDESMNRHEVVHQVRKRCKKVRGLLRLVRPQCEEAYQFENAQFRDAAGRLSGVRDAKSVCECLDVLLDRFKDRVETTAFDSTRQSLGERKRRIARECHDLEERLEQFRSALESARERIPLWPFNERGFSGTAAGLQKTYRRGRKAMQAAYDDPTVERFHEWRKRVKYHWYHMRLLRNAWKPVLQVRKEELKQLSDDLGDLHDLAVLREILLADPDRYSPPEDLRTLLELIEIRSAEFAKRSQALGGRIFAEKPKRLTRRLKGYWKVWRERQPSGNDVMPEEMLAGV